MTNRRLCEAERERISERKRERERQRERYRRNMLWIKTDSIILLLFLNDILVMQTLTETKLLFLKWE